MREGVVAVNVIAIDGIRAPGAGIRNSPGELFNETKRGIECQE